MIAAIQSMLYPRGVAVVGSVTPGKLGNVLTNRILEGGYMSVYNVNPKAQGVTGAGYASVQDIPHPVDLVILACPAATVPDMLLDAGKAGVTSAVVISSGFSEVGNHDLEQQVIAAAKQAGIRYVGPNCAGIINTQNGLVATLETAPKAGRVSLLSQSGAIGGAFMDAANKSGLGLGKFLSFGNGSDLNGTSMLGYLADDPDTDVICMYLENVKGGRDFMAALADATSKKPVVIIKSGRTAGGQRAAQSHTGAMAGSDAVYDAVFAKCGALRASSVDEMIDMAKALSANVHKQRTGKRMAIITNSGGPGVLTADRCETLGLSVAAPSDACKAGLSEVLPSFAGLSNPIDVTVEGTPEQYGAALSGCLAEYDAAIVIYVGTPYLLAKPVAAAVAEAAKKYDKPVSCYFAVGADIAEAEALLASSGVACYDSGERAATGLAGLLSYTGKSGCLAPEQTPVPLKKPYLLEPDAMDILSSLGVQTPPHFVAHTEAEAAEYAGKLGYPVCMKVVSRDIIHKSDVGGVKLNIADDGAAREAFAALNGICAGKDFSGVILYPMLKKGVEVIMGLVRDATFGPVVAFGLGGIFTEILKDVSMTAAPLSLDEARSLIASVRAYKLLTGARGGKPCDIEALANTLVRLSQLMFLHEEINEVDCNPVFAYEDGALVAVVRMIVK